jgi:cysteine desulfurase
VSWLDVDSEGALELDQLRDHLSDDTAIVSVMLANNETGILFPVNDVGAVVKEHSNALFHVDGVNAVGKIPIDLSSGLVDLFSISAHKFHGPKGIGALYIRNGVKLPSFAIGGGQESGRRAGTEAVHQIAGIGAAAELVRDPSAMENVRSLRDKLENAILSSIPIASLNGTNDPSRRLPNTSNISFENLNGEGSSGASRRRGHLCLDRFRMQRRRPHGICSPASDGHSLFESYGIDSVLAGKV